MRTRYLSALALAGLVFAWPAPIRAGEKEALQPVMTVRVRSLESIFDNVRLFARLLDKEEMGRQIEGIIKAKAGPKGLEGIDQKRPLGVYTNVGNDLYNVAAVAIIPVADEKALLDLLENLNFPAKKGDDGLYTIEPQGLLPVAIYFRFAHKYGYFTAINAEAVNKDKLIRPDKVFPAGRSALASLTIRLDQIPDVAKQIALQQVDDAIAREKEKKLPQETEKQREFREAVMETFAVRTAEVIRQGQLLNVDLDVDHASNKLKAQVSLAGKPGSALAGKIDKMGQVTSEFAALVSPENAFSGLVHYTLPKELSTRFAAVVEEGARQGLANEKDEGKRLRGKLLLKSLEPTLTTGELDAAVVLRGPSRQQTYTVIAGLKLKDGLEVEKAFRDVVKDVPPAERDMIKLDAETVEGVKVHRVDAQAKYDAKARAFLGDNPVYIAFRSDAVLVAVGEDGLAAMKQGLAAQPKGTAPVRVQFSVERLAGTFAKTPEQQGVVRKAFSEGNTGEVRIALEGGAALRLSLTADLSILRFAGLFYMERQRHNEPASSTN
jgi:hypothetical protein